MVVIKALFALGLGVCGFAVGGVLVGWMFDTFGALDDIRGRWLWKVKSGTQVLLFLVMFYGGCKLTSLTSSISDDK